MCNRSIAPTLLFLLVVSAFGLKTVQASPFYSAALYSAKLAQESAISKVSVSRQPSLAGQIQANVIKVRGRRLGMRNSFIRRRIRSARVYGVRRAHVRSRIRARRSVYVGRRGVHYVSPARYHRLRPTRRIRRVDIPRRLKRRTLIFYPGVYGARYKLRRCYQPQARRYYYAGHCRIQVRRIRIR